MDPGTVAIVSVIAVVFNMLVTALGGVVFMMRLEGRMNVQDVKLVAVETTVNATKAIVTASAVHESEIKDIKGDVQNLETDVRNLRRGVGWINDGERNGLSTKHY